MIIAFIDKLYGAEETTKLCSDLPKIIIDIFYCRYFFIFKC